MHSSDITTLIQAVDKLRATLRSYIDGLSALSPSQLEAALGMAMTGTKQGDRLGALLNYLNAQPANLRLQLRYEHGKLVFGTFWLQSEGALLAENRLLALECPAAVKFYLEAPTLKPRYPHLERGLNGALLVLAHRWQIEPGEVLRRGLAMLISRHHAAIEALVAAPNVRRENAAMLDELAKQGVYWQEVIQAVAAARDEMELPEKAGEALTR